MRKIDECDLDFYKDNGFVLLPNALSDSMLKRLVALSEALELSAKQELSEDKISSQYYLSSESSEPKLFRYNDLLFDAPELIIELLAIPTMMAISNQFCGIGCVPMQCDLVYKYPHPHPHIAWHQGAPHPRNFAYLNVGIYLDDAKVDDGCLRYVPNSQHELVDIYSLSSKYGWNIPGVVQQPAKAGDILVQDMMILHSSEPKRSDGPRRTIYVELRPLEGIEESQYQSKEWAELRKQWMAHIIKAAAPEDIPENWLAVYGDPTYDLKTLVELIKQKREPAIPAVWASKNVEHPDYPTPADLR
ncbi:phytanoyl-CoA dioxygenase family protein [Pseudoalteromonas sp. OF7H-1]|uniref:phytanoyl-CoA dioxygenase family protein n=1 Tax=Pseudoalteromonas sp. OF7H-1 TaxID=2917755 RepID=UPI001EF4D5CB|nr:phytanoyl-CoA dioxygenase family protein [Pseudoalteromonas sp. OF7H-1]MCG7539187.1 phytanoyl-CoA dioxygenase family protein [Pseudoalteromonas sp. OF7H-1]